MRFVERKTQNVWSLLRQGWLWANSPALSPVRLEAGRVGRANGRAAGARAGTVGVMDTSWWLALAAVVLLALVAALVDGWGRGHRPAGRGTALRTRGREGGPQPAEIWWAGVPFEDRPGNKDRPCLVLAVRGERVTVAKITTKSGGGRAGVIPLPPGSVGDVRGRASFLQTDELRDVPLWDFRRRVGPVDPALWDQVRHLAG